MIRSTACAVRRSVLRTTRDGGRLMLVTSDLQPAAARTHRPVHLRRWWRPWIAPLIAIALAFIAFSLPPYLSLDPARSRVQPPAPYAWYFPMLVAHVVFGSVAMLTCCLQVWPRGSPPVPSRASHDWQDLRPWRSAASGTDRPGNGDREPVWSDHSREQRPDGVALAGVHDYGLSNGEAAAIRRASSMDDP